MTKKDLEFIVSLKKNLSFSAYFYACLAVLAFSNAYYAYVPKIDIALSIYAGAFLCYVSFNNYLGETKLHKCSAIIDELINNNPEIIRQMKDINKAEK